MTDGEINRRIGWLVIRRMAPYLWPKDRPDARARVVLALACLALAKLAGVTAPFFFKAAVDSLALNPDELSSAYVLALGAVGLTLAYAFLRFIMVCFNELRDVIFARVGQRALRTLALKTFQHLHALSLRYHLSRKTGGLSRIIERGVKGVDFLLRFMLFSIFPLILELMMVAGILFVIFDFRYLAVVLATISVYIWFTFKVTEWRVQIRKEMNVQDTEANQRAIDSLLNFETIKYFDAEQRESMRYDDSMQGYERAALKTSYSLAFLNIGQSFMITCGLVTVMIMAAFGVQSGQLTVGDFVLVNAYMLQITLPLNFLGTVYREIRQALIDMSEMFNLLEQDPEVTDRPDATELVVSDGEIVFDEVSFGYHPDRPILKALSFRVGPGETVAVVGPSGSGKSTIGRLLFRFYDVGGGSVRIDGQDVRHVTQRSVHKAIGIVPQDTVLFNESIGYNIAYGHHMASRERIEAAARAARIHDFIAELPDGYRTTVGERGLKLSGGEKQRVGIARTILKNPPILLLDEATSALDTATEKEIKVSLNEMSQGRSVIMIAHRLSTVVDADRILVLENGRVIEQGRHEDLLARQGRYAGMWHHQLSESESDDRKVTGEHETLANRDELSVPG